MSNVAAQPSTASADYLVGFGTAGDFGRFRSVSSATFERGDPVILRTSNGTEAGVVMCAATDALDPFLARQPLGELLRHQTEDDDQNAAAMRQRGESLLLDAQRLADELNLPLHFVDADFTLDGSRATLSYLRPYECDYRPLVSALSKRYDVFIIMQNLTIALEAGQGCGKPDCGKGEGGCSTCGTGGGCSTGSCGSGMKKEDVASKLAALANDDAELIRTPLL